jgi:hypothetical protein
MQAVCMCAFSDGVLNRNGSVAVVMPEVRAGYVSRGTAHTGVMLGEPTYWMRRELLDRSDTHSEHLFEQYFYRQNKSTFEDWLVD